MTEVTEPEAPAMPKMDLKMMVLPAMFLLQKQIDMKDSENINMARMGLFTVCVIALGSYLMVHQMVTSKNDKTLIWVPPKAQPALPFGPQPEPPKPEDYVATTYKDHEIKLVFEALQALAVSVGIAVFMSFKFDIHMSCMMNCVMVPLGLYDNVLIKSYILGNKQENPYNEVMSDPNVEPPRVEELDDEDEDKVSSNDEVQKDDNEEEEDAVKIEKSDVSGADDID
eukprot:CAMPEP_0114425696 /NCGR_PEP_ID=MMETSP0103-20121206/7379_1 /TAXON_ID=37642 ORGANISM="Paraphysomonas imperforata, Strain PA2" /NCGR_SAMPLE_ID=MMETSP0103 /ASSEMBLY_ACC=CAM_ASM_000201 /LENGTH=225 /DNA_ID=CAMNT_0001594561 /DNA_START=22 /DNA_END=699 /DNA_ORIENTATION=-